MILAGEIGATRTRLAALSKAEGQPVLQRLFGKRLREPEHDGIGILTDL